MIRPAFDALLRRPTERRPHIIVFATDGFGPAPITAPRDVLVIWLLVGAQAVRPARWGEVVRVD